MITIQTGEQVMARHIEYFEPHVIVVVYIIRKGNVLVRSRRVREYLGIKISIRIIFGHRQLLEFTIQVYHSFHHPIFKIFDLISIRASYVGIRPNVLRKDIPFLKISD